jgi:hypothetical protein
MGGISVFAKLVYSIDLAEKTGQFNYFDERLRLRAPQGYAKAKIVDGSKNSCYDFGLCL